MELPTKVAVFAEDCDFRVFTALERTNKGVRLATEQGLA